MSDDFTGADFSTVASGASATATGETSAAPGDLSAASTEPAATAPAETPLDAAIAEPVKPAGPIPFEVHKTALENARTKATADWESRYGWAKDLQRDEVQQLIAFRQALQADPVATLGQEFATLVDHPVYGPQLRSFLGRQLGAGRAAPSAAAPLPTLQLEDGRQIDLQALKESIRAETLADATKQFQPALDAASKLQAAQAQFEMQTQAEAFAKGLAPELEALPQLKEHRAQLLEAFAKEPLRSDHPAEVTAAFYRVYHRIVTPTLQVATRQAVLSDLQRQAAASTVNPAQSGTRAPKSVDQMSIKEALEHFAAQAG